MNGKDIVKKLSQIPDCDKTSMLATRVDTVTYKKFVALCKKNKVRVTDVVRAFIKQFIEDLEE